MSSADGPQAGSQSSDEKATPPAFLDPLAEAVGGFDVDPASGAEPEPLADTTYTIEEDGLSQDWTGIVWVNPPFSDMMPWVEKIIDEISSDRVESILLLCKGDSSTNWWQKAAKEATLITAVDHRLQFQGTDYAAPFPVHLMVFGDVSPALLDALEDHGLLLTDFEDANTLTP